MPRACLVIMGPTAAGKSALALKLARDFDGEIITADSRQIYRGMDIGTDKPGSRQQAVGRRNEMTTARCPLPTARTRDEPVPVEGVPHYLIDILTPDQRYSAAEFRDDATRIIADIHRRGKLPMVVGGTGFFIRVLTGDRTIPSVPPHPPLRAWAETQPVEALAHELQERAPDLGARVDNLKNKRRVVRALEIARGQESNKNASLTPYSLLLTPYTFLKLALLPLPEVLQEQIEARVADQLRRGFIEEARRLVEQYGKDAPGLQAVGYRQIFPYLHGQATFEETRQAITRANRRYARRQRTWLKKEPHLTKASSPEEAHRAVAAWLLGFSKREAGGA